MNDSVLIVEDDADINALLKTILAKEGYEVIQAFSGTEAELVLDKKIPELILLDLMLPGMSGENLLYKIREEKNCKVPVLILSAKNALKDKVNLLKGGADDYITKPFEPEEVIARVYAAIRRNRLHSTGSIQESFFTFKNLKLYPELRKVTVKEIEIVLTAREFGLMYFMIQNQEKVFSRERLYEAVWKDGYYGSDHTVNVHISNLRRKIRQYDSQEYIQSVYGIGFRLAKT